MICKLYLKKLLKNLGAIRRSFNFKQESAIIGFVLCNVFSGLSMEVGWDRTRLKRVSLVRRKLH